MKKKKHTPSQPTGQPPVNYLSRIAKNLLFAFLLGFLLFKAMENNAGYPWAYNMLTSNMKLIRANPHLTLKEKNEMKLGTDFAYLWFLKEATPENAVILYPSTEDFYPPDKPSPFKQEVQNKIWALRFLYPRLLVLPSEMETSPYAPEITHVAIVNGRGYERLDYPVEHKQEHGILPVKP
ncbi:MAG: hypothetical protein LBD89_09545 [Tannerellaceae bacterium]|jgi:hypothetical protein|nr:hypothetical protein [Tannerellaceae bacterium]